jgi:predicted permease
MDAALRDLRYAVRQLRRSPALVVVAVISLGLGIGANSVVFGTARALLLRPLPIPEPDRVFFVQASNSSGSFDNFSFPNYVDFRDRAAPSMRLAAFRVAEASIDAGAGARSAWGYLATGNYFGMLRIQPAAGRFYTAQEDVGRNASPYIVLSNNYWQAAFDGDAAVIGRVVRVNGRPYTVVGVAPEGFHGTEVFFQPDFWIPMTMAPQLEGSVWIDSRTSRNVYIAGRLTDGTTAATAESSIAGITRTLSAEYPAINRDLTVRLTTPGLFGDLLRGPASTFAGATLAFSMLVLLAACANIASLLAARVIDRQRELAVRLSLGATRPGIARQLFVETVLLCGCGALAGLAVAVIALRLLTHWRPGVGFPFAVNVLPDVPVFAFGALAALAAALIAVGASARRAWRADPAVLTRPPERSSSRRWSAREALFGAQISVCSLLIISCLVSIQGLRSTLETYLGFNPVNVYVASFDLNQAGYDRARGQVLRSQMIDRLSTQPGIDGATFTSSIQLTTDQSTDAVVADTAAPGTRGIDAHAFIVPAGYFRVIQTRLISGREFQWSDTRVAIINATLARQLFGTTDVVGRGLRRVPGSPIIQLVGVAEDGKYAVPGEAPQPAIYWPASQNYRSSTQLLIRSRLPEDQVVRLTRDTIAGLDASLPATFQGPLRDVTSLAFLPAKAAAVMLGTLGLLALVLAFGGIYGVAAYSVSARTREIGIRIALGGRSIQVLRSVLGRTAALVTAGTAIGAMLAIAARPLLSMVVYQASSRDPLVLILAAAVMIAIGLGGASAPAARAIRIDPVGAIRSE